MKLERVITRTRGVSRARLVKRGSLKVVAIFVSSACCIGSAWPQNSQSDDLAQDQISVRELMRLDTALALSQTKDKLHSRNRTTPAVDSRGLPAHGGGLRLVAIYGVGKKLLAEVHIGSKPHVYVRGKALPVGVSADPSAFHLRGITGSCIQLERKDEAHTLCLHPALWVQG
jgi:hypothetical protein